MQAQGEAAKHRDDGVVEQVYRIAHAADDGDELIAEYFFEGAVLQHREVEKHEQEGEAYAGCKQCCRRNKLVLNGKVYNGYEAERGKRGNPFFIYQGGSGVAYIEIGQEDADKEILGKAVDAEKEWRVAPLGNDDAYGGNNKYSPAAEPG